MLPTTRPSPLRRAFLGIAVALAALAPLGCQAKYLSWQEEIAMGEQYKGELLKEMGGEVARADLREYVREVGMKLVQTTAQDDPGYLNLPWEFFLLDSDVVNAFALPGGKIYMSRGLAQLMTNEAQLAGVLGHEIGHVTARHTNERYSRMMNAQIGIGVLGAVLGSGAGELATQSAGQALQIALLSYDRDQESESDLLGMRYMTRAGYNPAAQRDVMLILKSKAGGSNQPEFLSTHPLPESRIRDIDNLLATEFAYTQNNPSFITNESQFRQRFLNRLAEAYPAAGTPRFDAAAARDEFERIAKAQGHNPADIACEHHQH